MILNKSLGLAILALTLGAFASCKQKIADGNTRAALAADEVKKKALAPVPECEHFPDHIVFKPQLAEDFKKSVTGGFYNPASVPRNNFNSVGADADDAKNVERIIKERAHYVQAFTVASKAEVDLASAIKVDKNLKIDTQMADVNKKWHDTLKALMYLEDACSSRLVSRAANLK